MIRPLKSNQIEFSRALRHLASDAEIRLWAKLRNRQLAGAKFRRQQHVGRYIADFVCAEARLIVEADGGQHASQLAYDEARTAFLQREGYRVLRFWNNHVLKNTDAVLEDFYQALCDSPSPAQAAPESSSPLKGEGLTIPLSLEGRGDSWPPGPPAGEGEVPGIDDAIAVLRDGGIVALPTETVYGLAADAANGEAVARIYAAKGRPSFNPLIVHVSGVAMAETLVDIPPLARDLMARFWPGALTLVLPLKMGAPVAGLVTAGLPTLAVRCPAHPVMQAVIAGLGRPLAAPSANASGRISATTAAHVAASLGDRVPLILDGGPTSAGVESTIVAIDGDRATLLRPGAVPADMLGIPLGAAGPAIIAPGQLASHYAPSQPLRINALTADSGEFHIGFGVTGGDLNLSVTADLTEAAANLFAALHSAEASGCSRIAVAPVPNFGLGVAINDRLNRAAATRG